MSELADLPDWEPIQSDPEFTALPKEGQLGVLDAWSNHLGETLKAAGATPEHLSDFTTYVADRQIAINHSGETKGAVDETALPKQQSIQEFIQGYRRSLTNQYGGYSEQWNDRDIRGRPGHKSMHATGEAIDFYNSPEIMGPLSQELTQSGVKRVIYNRQEWTPSDGWHPYTGRHPHDDHIHIEPLINALFPEIDVGGAPQQPIARKTPGVSPLLQRRLEQQGITPDEALPPVMDEVSPTLDFTAEGTNYTPAVGGKIEGGPLGAGSWHGQKLPAQEPLHTLDQYRRGESPYVSVAMDNTHENPLAYGTMLSSPDIPGVPFRVMDTGGAFNGKNPKYGGPKGLSRIDIARDVANAKDQETNRPIRFTLAAPQEQAIGQAGATDIPAEQQTAGAEAGGALPPDQSQASGEAGGGFTAGRTVTPATPEQQAEGESGIETGLATLNYLSAIQGYGDAATREKARAEHANDAPPSRSMLDTPQGTLGGIESPDPTVDQFHDHPLLADFADIGSATQAIQRRFTDSNILGTTVGGGIVGAAAMALAPETGGLSLLALGLAGAYLGGEAGGATQDQARRLTETPEQTDAREQQLAIDEQNHPYAVKAADIGAAALLFRPSPTALANSARGLGYIRYGLPLPAVEKAALQNTLLAAGIGATQTLGMHAATGQPIKVEDVIDGAVTMAFLNHPTPLGRALGYAIHEAPGPREAIRPASEVATEQPPTQPAPAKPPPIPPKEAPPSAPPADQLTAEAPKLEAAGMPETAKAAAEPPPAVEQPPEAGPATAPAEGAAAAAPVAHGEFPQEGYTAASGTPSTIRLFHGSHEQFAPGEIKSEGIPRTSTTDNEVVGAFLTPDESFAKTFGPNVHGYDATLSNTLDLRTEPQGEMTFPQFVQFLNDRGLDVTANDVRALAKNEPGVRQPDVPYDWEGGWASVVERLSGTIRHKGFDSIVDTTSHQETDAPVDQYAVLDTKALKPVGEPAAAPEGPSIQASASEVGLNPAEIQDFVQGTNKTGINPEMRGEEGLRQQVERIQQAPRESFTSATAEPDEAPAPASPVKAPEPLTPAPEGGVTPEERTAFEATGMQRANAGERGATTLIPDALDHVVNVGKRIYRSGMDFADWSREMVRGLGEAVRPYLQKAWEALKGTAQWLAHGEIRPEFRESGSIFGSAKRIAKQAFKEQTEPEKWSDARKAALAHHRNEQSSFGEVTRASKAANKTFRTEREGNAASIWREANGDPVVLADWAAKANDPRLKQAAEDAQRLTLEQRTFLAGTVKPTFATLGARAERYELLKATVQNYVPHLTEDRETGRAIGGQPSGRRLTSTTRHGKQRTFDTFFDADQAATLPDGTSRYRAKTLDIRQLFPQYISEVNRAIGAKQLVRDAAAGVASDGSPLVLPRNEGTSVVETPAPPPGAYAKKAVLNFEKAPKEEARGYKDLGEHPALRSWQWTGKDSAGNPVFRKSDLVVHPELYKFLNAAVGESGIQAWMNEPGATVIGSALRGAAKGVAIGQAYAKGTMMGFLSPFHQVTEAQHAMGHRTNPLFGFDSPDPSVNPSARFAAEHGLALYPTHSSSHDYAEGVGGKQRNLTTLVLKKTPGLNAIGGRAVAELAEAYQDYLFQKYIPALKLKTFENALSRNRELYAKQIADGTYSDDQIAHLTATQINAAYGHLNYTDLQRNPTVQHALRLVALAPDFLEARTRFMGQGLFRGKAGVEQLKALALGSAIIAGAAAVVNFTVGDKKLHPDDPFAAYVGNRKYRIRNVAEDFFPMVKDAISTVHHRTLDLEGTRRFFDARLSPWIGRGLLELLSGRNWRGEKAKAGTIITDLVTSSVVPMSVRPFLKLTATDEQRTISPLEESLHSLGVNLNRASPVTETYQLAKLWREANQIPEKTGEFPASQYQQLRFALEDGDDAKAKAEIEKLVKSGAGGRKGLGLAFRESTLHPFAGSRVNDSKFSEWLTGDDKLTYEAALERRRKILTRFEQSASGKPMR